MARPVLHRGEVVLVTFPFTDLTGTKVRPAVRTFGAKGCL
jgi:hypothetical protein